MMRGIPIIIGALVVTIAGTALWRLSERGDGDGSIPASVAVLPTASVAAGNVRRAPVDEAGVTLTVPVQPPTGDRSESGAVHAAVSFLELDEQLFPTATPASARALSDSITAEVSKARLGNRAEQHQHETLAKGDLEGLVLRVAPIAARVRNHTSTRCTVDVFFLRLWSFPAKGALDDYATAQLDLVWEHNTWKLLDSSVIDGPYPVARFSAHPVIASTARRFEAILAGFSDQYLHR